jgi:hypothetical protein
VARSKGDKFCCVTELGLQVAQELQHFIGTVAISCVAGKNDVCGIGVSLLEEGELP